MFHTFIFLPLYNFFIFLLSITGGSLGLSIICITLLLKLILFPLSKKATESQQKMKQVAPELELLKKKYTDKQELAREQLALYQRNNISLFGGILPLFIQLPILIGLYSVIFRGGLPIVNLESLYSFIHAPQVVLTTFFTIDLMQKSLILAVLAGVTQYFLAQATAVKPDPATAGDAISFEKEFSKSLYFQMLYFFPIMIGVMSYYLSASIALYFVVTNISSVAQDMFIKRSQS
jgi:YidC/Oxa1 family membrane protein insertase